MQILRSKDLHLLFNTMLITNTIIQVFSIAISFKTRMEHLLFNKYIIRWIHILSKVKLIIKLNRSMHLLRGLYLLSNHLINQLEINNIIKKMHNPQVCFKIFPWMSTLRSFKRIKILKVAILKAPMLDNNCTFNIINRILVKTWIKIINK